VNDDCCFCATKNTTNVVHRNKLKEEGGEMPAKIHLMIVQKTMQIKGNCQANARFHCVHFFTFQMLTFLSSFDYLSNTQLWVHVSDVKNDSLNH